MGTGILVCGLNGCGKSTLGKLLAEQLGFLFLDDEALFFPETDADYIYSAPRSKDEVKKRLLHEIRARENFVFASVKGNYGEEILPFYRYAVLLQVPKAIRLQRMKNRSFEKFGDRMLPGGDLYTREKAFYDMASARTECYVEDWLQTLNCPILRVDGMKPPAENVSWIISQIRL